MRVKHIAWNLAGLSLPLTTAALTVPHLLNALGGEKFGLLALAWGLIGYASALDMGIGRAVTQMMARLRATADYTDIGEILHTAAIITMTAGIFSGVCIAIFAMRDGYSVINVAFVSPLELKYSVLLLAIALPAQAMSATYKGVNEAFQKFRGVNILRILLGILNFGGPFLVSMYTTKLHWLVFTLVASRIAALLVYRWLAFSCIRSITHDKGGSAYSSSVARSLFKFGGWVTLSNVISPMMTQADRFLIASTISAAAVSLYVLPYEIVVQSLILVGAITTSIFPSLAKMIVEQPQEWQSFFLKWLAIVASTMAIACMLIALTLPVILKIWLNTTIPEESIEIGKVLCIGVFANAVGSMFYALLHAQSRTSTTAKIHLIELPLYLISLIMMLDKFGPVGAAYAWVGRMIFDALVLAYQSKNSIFQRIK